MRLMGGLGGAPGRRGWALSLQKTHAGWWGAIVSELGATFNELLGLDMKVTRSARAMKKGTMLTISIMFQMLLR